MKLTTRTEINVVVKNEHFDPWFLPHLFGPELPNDLPILFVETTDMFDVLFQVGLFGSKSDAKRNWKRTNREIPHGFTDLKDIGKLNHRLTIWRPIKEQL